MLRTSLLALALVGGMTASARAVPTITAGDHIMSYGQFIYVIPIKIFDDGQGTPLPGLPPGQIRGTYLSLLVGDGTEGPMITKVDLVGVGTIFHGNNVGQSDFASPFGPPSRETASFTSALGSSTVSANGVLAYVTIDISPAQPGNYTFQLSSPDLGPTDIGDPEVQPILIDGILTLIPEPASIVMGLMGAAALGAVAIRKRRDRG